MQRILVSLLLASAIITALGQGKSKQTKPDLPKVFENARYVFVEASSGDRDGLDPYADERQAISDVEKSLHDWNRYRTTINRDEADLVLVVHKAHRTNSNIPVVMGGGPPRGKSPFPRDPASDPTQDGGASGGTGLGRESGSPDDQLSVYLVGPSGSLGSRIWIQSQKNGLKSPQLALFQRLKKDVEEAYPQ